MAIAASCWQTQATPRGRASGSGAHGPAGRARPPHGRGRGEPPGPTSGQRARMRGPRGVSAGNKRGARGRTKAGSRPWSPNAAGPGTGLNPGFRSPLYAAPFLFQEETPAPAPSPAGARTRSPQTAAWSPGAHGSARSAVSPRGPGARASAAPTVRRGSGCAPSGVATKLVLRMRGPPSALGGTRPRPPPALPSSGPARSVQNSDASVPWDGGRPACERGERLPRAPAAPRCSRAGRRLPVR